MFCLDRSRMKSHSCLFSGENSETNHRKNKILFIRNIYWAGDYHTTKHYNNIKYSGGSLGFGGSVVGTRLSLLHSKPLAAWLVPQGVLVTEGSGSLQTPETAPIPATSTNSPIPTTGFLIIRKAPLCHFLLVLSVSRKSEERKKAEKKRKRWKHLITISY